MSVKDIRNKTRGDGKLGRRNGNTGTGTSKSMTARSTVVRGEKKSKTKKYVTMVRDVEKHKVTKSS